MSEIERHIIQARRFEFGRVHHYRDAEALYEKDSASDECAVALGRLCMENGQFSLMKRRTDTLARLRRAAATSEPSFTRKLAIYIAYLNGGWNRESTNLLYLASQRGDCLAGYIMSILLDRYGDVVMNHLSLLIADRKTLSLDCLLRSVRLGFLEASCVLGSYYCELGREEEGWWMLTRAAEAGYFPALQELTRHCRSVGSDACCVDEKAYLSHAKRLACDMKDLFTAGHLADYLANGERGAFVDRVAALRFLRRSFRKRPSEHTYVVFPDRRWKRGDGVFWGSWLRFLRDDLLLESEPSQFPVVHMSGPLQVHYKGRRAIGLANRLESSPLLRTEGVKQPPTTSVLGPL